MLGAAVGIISGLVPGLHPNLFGSLLSFYSALSAMIFYKYFSHIREIFLMVPDENNVLALHPMYKMYKEGQGFRALLLSNFGLLISSLIAFILLPLLIPLVYDLVKISKIVGWIFLLVSIIILVLTSKDRWKTTAIILLSGLLGIFALKIENGIVPLLSGLFAVPLLISKTKLSKKQKVSWRIKINLKSALLGFISSIFLIITPAIGPTQSAIIARKFTSDEEFLFTMGVINGFDIILAIIMFLLFGYSRSGVINESFSTVNPRGIYPIVALGIGLSFIGFITSVELGKIFCKRNFNLEKIKFFSLLVLIIISYLVAGASGIIIFTTAASIGILTNKLKVRMVNCMGSLMIPSLLKKFI